jgi:hypothetical protein
VARRGELPARDLAGLLHQWSAAQLASLSALDRPVEAAVRTGTLLRAPASEAEVAAAERRLEVHLPPSYREFLLLSDGAYGDTMGAVTADDPRAGDSLEGWGFLPVAELRRYDEADPEAVDIWLQAQDEIESASGGTAPAPPFEGDEVRDHRPMRDALLIARGFDANCSLLVPVDDPGAGEEWEVWSRYKEGGTRWSSFRAYLGDVVEEHLGVDVDGPEALLLLAGAEAGNQAAAQRLARVRSPEASGLLIDAARRGAVPHAVLPALARIGGPEVVALLTELRLGSWQQQYVHSALARIGTQDALDHLAAVGAYWHLAGAGDPRAAGIAGAQLHQGDAPAVLGAARLLTQLPDPRWVPDLLGAYERIPHAEVRNTILYALDACGAPEEARRRAPDLLAGPYGYSARALLERLSRTTGPTRRPRVVRPELQHRRAGFELRRSQGRPRRDAT